MLNVLLPMLSLFTNLVVLSFLYIEKKNLKYSITVIALSSFVVFGSFINLLNILIPETQVLIGVIKIQEIGITLMPALLVVYMLQFSKHAILKNRYSLWVIITIPLILLLIGVKLLINTYIVLFIGVSFFLFYKSKRRKSSFGQFTLLSIFFPILAASITYLLIGSDLFTLPLFIALFGLYFAFTITKGLSQKGLLLPTPLLLGHIRTQIFAAFLLVSTIVILASTILIYTSIESISKNSFESELTTVINSYKHETQNFIDSLEQKTEGIINIEELDKYLNNQSDKNMASLKKEFKGVMSIDPTIINITLFSPSKKLILSMNPDVKDVTSLIERKDEQLFINKDTREILTVEYIMPIYNDNSTLIAYIGITTDYSEFSVILTENHTAHKSFESYLIKETGEILTPFEKEKLEPVLTYRVPVLIYEQCAGLSELSPLFELTIEGKQKNFMVTKIKNSSFCLVSSIAQDEVTLSIKSSLSLVFIVSFFSLMFAAIAADLIGIFISSPIEKLTKDVEKVYKGDLSHRTKINLVNEIGTLANTHNKMTDQLQELYGSMDEKVKEQTADLTQQRNSLVRQQKQMINILSDLEEEKDRSEELTGQLKKFELAVESSSNSIVITNREGNIVYTNPAVEIITGFSKEDLAGQKAGSKENWGGQMPVEFYKELWNIIVTKKETFTGELKNKKKDGTIYDVQATISPVINSAGDIQFLVGIERDISKEKQIDKAKTEFVSLASHQLRTPLSAINWYVEMLMDGDAGPITIAQKEYLSEIYEGNNRMVDLVGALLNVSRLELGTFSVEPVQLNIVSLAKKALKELEQLIEEKQIKVKTRFSKDIKQIPLDKRLTYIIFQNVFSNAIKYTPKKGNVSIKIEKNSRYITITVKDSGMGIPKKDQAGIFSKLYRASNARNKVIEGTGLGLYIVKSILDSVRGKITFTSKEGKGTTFVVKILASGMKAKKGSKKL